MNKLYAIITIFLFSYSIQAQQIGRAKAANEAKPFNKTYYTGLESSVEGLKEKKANARYPYKIAGRTLYDLQSNGPVCNRLAFNKDGNLIATWTMALASDFADRGTGYNFITGGAWGPEPTSRIDNVRTGWPNINVDIDGKETVIAHDFTNNNYHLNMMSKIAGTSTWVASTIPSDAPLGVLWPRTAVGGSNGKTIHAIAIAPPVASSGVIYRGVDGHILYFRSPDGGLTWDRKDYVIPGLDSVDYASMDSDSYSLSVRGNTVAILIQSQWSDIVVFKSSDNGDTWHKHTIKKFPLKRYVRDSPYTIDDIGGVDTLGPGGAADPPLAAQLAIYSNDGAGNLTIDKNGKVHAFWGDMYITDDTPGDGSSSYYPLWSGLSYWNEDMGENNFSRNQFDVLDENGNGTLDIEASENVALYYTSLSSYPTAAADDQGNVFLAYSALSETNKSAVPQHYRHILITSSTDGGNNWKVPVDVINEQLDADPTFYLFVEAVFPNIAVKGNELHLTYLHDYEPGINLQGDMDPITENEIAHLIFDKSTLTLIESVKKPAHFEMSISPNPSSSIAVLDFKLAKTKDVSIDIFDINGRMVSSKKLGNLATGDYSESLEIQSLHNGTYIVKLRAGVETASMQLIKQ